MKALLLKDFYLVRSVLFIIFLVFAVVGGGFSFITTPWVLTVIAAAMLGMIAVTTINMDKSSGWRKVTYVMPVSRKTALDSKYVLYVLMSGAGFLLGTILGIVVSLVKNEFDMESMGLYMAVSMTIALLTGSISIPCSFVLSEEKSVIGMVIAYPLATLLFIGAFLLIKDKMAACGAVAALGGISYGLSWWVSRKVIPQKDLT